MVFSCTGRPFTGTRPPFPQLLSLLLSHCVAMLRLFRSKSATFGCRANKIPGKAALLGAERTKSLEEQHFLGCRANKIPEKKSTFGCTANKIPGKTALSGAERTNSLEKTALLGAKRRKSLEIIAFWGAERTKSLG